MKLTKEEAQLIAKKGLASTKKFGLPQKEKPKK